MYIQSTVNYIPVTYDVRRSGNLERTNECKKRIPA